MAITAKGFVGSIASGSNTTSIGFPVGLATAIGDVLVVCIAKDNSLTTTGAATEVTSVTDTQGNTWHRITGYRVSSGIANDGAEAEMWYTKLTTAVSPALSSVITTNFSSTTAAKAVECYAFTGFTDIPTIAQSSATSYLNQTGTGIPSHSTSSLASGEYLTVRMWARELGSTTTATLTTGWTGVSGAVPVSNANTGNTAGMSVLGEFIIATGAGWTSSMQANGSTSTDFVSIIASISNGVIANLQMTGFVGTF